MALLTHNMRKSRISLAYIAAIAARCGYTCQERGIDIDSIDGQLNSSLGSCPQIDFQAKSTGRDIVKDGHIAFPLPLKNYDDLRKTIISVPRMLLVVLMPQDEALWLHQTAEELALRCAGYWVSLRGKPEVENTKSVTVHVPMKNLFNEEQLHQLMVRVNDGATL